MIHPRSANWRRLCLAALFLICLLPVNAAIAQGAGSAADEERLIQRVKEAVMKELRESDFLQQEILSGIQAYVKAAKEAQAAAQVQRERHADEAAKNVRRVSPRRDHIRGKMDAEVSLIEYSDFECPFCKQFHTTPKQVVELYKGRVNWVYRHFPLSFHNPGAQKQAEGSECAAELGGNGAFWAFADAVYERTKSNGKGFPLDQLEPLAGEIGLNKQTFRVCLDSGKYAARVEEDLREGETIGINGTPGTIILNNKTGETRLLSGAMPLEAVKQKIDEILKQPE